MALLTGLAARHKNSTGGPTVTEGRVKLMVFFLVLVFSPAVEVYQKHSRHGVRETIQTVPALEILVSLDVLLFSGPTKPPSSLSSSF